jgi:hypothetical protein
MNAAILTAATLTLSRLLGGVLVAGVSWTVSWPEEDVVEVEVEVVDVDVVEVEVEVEEVVEVEVVGGGGGGL